MIAMFVHIYSMVQEDDHEASAERLMQKRDGFIKSMIHVFDEIDLNATGIISIDKLVQGGV